MKHDAHDTDYFSHVRTDIIAQIDIPVNQVLEIGAGTGATLIEIKKRGLAKEVTAIELLALPHTSQQDETIDHVLIGDIETSSTLLLGKHYDLIICADILEHLIDPWKVVATLHSALAVDGLLVASIPNIREIRSLLKIAVRGSFAYEPAGVFDKTHMRFFCQRDMQALFHDAGYTILHMQPSFRYFRNSMRFWLDRLTFGLFNEFLAVQYIIKAKAIHDTHATSFL